LDQRKIAAGGTSDMVADPTLRDDCHRFWSETKAGEKFLNNYHGDDLPCEVIKAPVRIRTFEKIEVEPVGDFISGLMDMYEIKENEKISESDACHDFWSETEAGNKFLKKYNSKTFEVIKAPTRVIKAPSRKRKFQEIEVESIDDFFGNLQDMYGIEEETEKNPDSASFQSPVKSKRRKVFFSPLRTPDKSRQEKVPLMPLDKGFKLRAEKDKETNSISKAEEAVRAATRTGSNKKKKRMFTTKKIYNLRNKGVKRNIRNILFPGAPKSR